MGKMFIGFFVFYYGLCLSIIGPGASTVAYCVLGVMSMIGAGAVLPYKKAFETAYDEFLEYYIEIEIDKME